MLYGVVIGRSVHLPAYSWPRLRLFPTASHPTPSGMKRQAAWVDSLSWLCRWVAPETVGQLDPKVMVPLERAG